MQLARKFLFVFSSLGLGLPPTDPAAPFLTLTSLDRSLFFIV